MLFMFWILFAATILGIAVVDGWLTRRRAAPLRAAEPPK